jgi:glycerophosphoryl diester phosphodiesterase
VKQLLVQSHRGGGALAPENTLESFVATWDAGLVPEADLRTTRDGVIVAFHDETLARVVRDIPPELRDKAVRDVTFAQLSALDAGAWKGEQYAGQRVCGVTEIFAAMRGRPDRGLYLDIKEVALPRLAALARDAEVTEQVIVAAPDEQILREWKALVPHGQTLLWMGILWKGDEGTLRQRLERLRAEDFAGITQLQIHIAATRDGDAWRFRPSLGFMREVADELGPRGILFQSIPWECDDAEVYRALLEAGVRSFASDYPDVALRVLREWAAAHPQ